MEWNEWLLLLVQWHWIPYFVEVVYVDVGLVVLIDGILCAGKCDLRTVVMDIGGRRGGCRASLQSALYSGFSLEGLSC